MDKKRFKSIWAVALAVCILIAILPFGAAEADATTYGEPPALEDVVNTQAQVPEEAVPKETVPEEASPEETIPGEATPAEPVPEAAAPEKAIPDETTEGGAALTEQIYTAAVYTDDTLTKPMSDGTIQISGALPAGGYAVAYPVELNLDTGEVLAAYDITVYWADGTKFEFDGSLTVSIELPGLSAGLWDEDLTLVYVPEEGEPEHLDTPVSVTDNGVSFDVEHFSTYAVVVTGVSNYSVTLDNGTPVTDSWTATNGGNYPGRKYAGTVYSTVPGEVHTMTFSSTNTNITFTGITKDGVAVPITSVNNPASATVTFTDSTVITFSYKNVQNTTVTVTLTITVVNQYLEIVDSIVQDGLLTAVPNAGLAPSVVSYTWLKSDSKNGAYIPSDAQAVSPDGKGVNPAVDSGTMMWYKVAATLDDGTVVYSDPYQIPYYYQIMNGSFELPTTLPANNGKFANVANGASDLYWRTTAQDGMVEIALNPSTYNISAAADGVRFAELNANYVGTLYQDVLVTPGETLYWSLAHAGRLGQDTMNVVIMPTRDVDLGNIPTASGGDVSVTTITDGQGTWGHYAGSYTVPDGVYVVRFFFVSVSTAGNDKTQGNLLDVITFSSKMPYTVEYYLDGVLQNVEESGYAATSTTIAAQHTSQFSQYKLQQTKLNGASLAGAPTSFRLAVADTVFQLYYVSTGLIINKTVDGVAPEDMPETYTVTFDLYEGDSVSGVKVASAAINMISGSLDGSVQVTDGGGNPFNLKPNTTYTVVETSAAEIAGYTPQTPPEPVSITTGGTASVYEADFANGYDIIPPPPAIDFSFTKVGADGSTPLSGVTFTLYPLDAETGEPDTANAIPATSGIDGLVSFPGLTDGDYKLVETSTVAGYALPMGYWVIHIENAEITGIEAQGSPPAFSTGTGGDGTTAYVLRNYPEQTLPRAGGMGNILFTVLGGALIGTSVLVMVSRKKNEKRTGKHQI